MVSVLQSLSLVPWVFCDTETTGLTPAKHRVWEICLSRFEAGKEVSRLETIINPAIQLDEDYHFRRPEGVTGEVLRRSPRWSEVSSHIEELCRGAVFIAHNAPFDARFVDAEQSFINRPSPIEAVICTQQLAKKLLPLMKSVALDALKRELKIRAEGEVHRAGHDVAVMTRLWLDHLVPLLGEVLLYEVIGFSGMTDHSPAMKEAA